MPPGSAASPSWPTKKHDMLVSKLLQNRPKNWKLLNISKVLYCVDVRRFVGEYFVDELIAAAAVFDARQCT